MNLYFISNAIALLFIVLIFIISLWMEGWTFKKITIKEMSIVSLFVALNVVLTNCIGYNFKFSSLNFSLALGQWLIFLTGVFFGPLLAFISGICSDFVGDIVNVGGLFHFGFTLSSCLCGLFGSLVFLFRKENKVILKIVVFYTLFYLLKTFLINPISYYCIGYYDAVFVNVIVNTIKTPILLSIYLSFIISSFCCLKVLVNNSFTTTIWFNRYKKES